MLILLFVGSDGAGLYGSVAMTMTPQQAEALSQRIVSQVGSQAIDPLKDGEFFDFFRLLGLFIFLLLCVVI